MTQITDTERLAQLEASNYIRGQNLEALRVTVQEMASLALSQRFDVLADFFAQFGLRLPPRHVYECGFPDLVSFKGKAFEISPRNFVILLHVVATLHAASAPAETAEPAPYWGLD